MMRGRDIYYIYIIYSLMYSLKYTLFSQKSHSQSHAQEPRNEAIQLVQLDAIFSSEFYCHVQKRTNLCKCNNFH